MDVKEVEAVPTVTSTEEQFGSEESTKIAQTESDRIAELEARNQETITNKDKGYEKMKTRYEAEINEMRSKYEELNTKFSTIEKQKTEIKKPKMPSNFNEDDIIDSDSDSAKYIKDLRNYEQAMKEAEYSESINIARELKSKIDQAEQIRKEQEDYNSKVEDTIQGIIDDGCTRKEAMEIAQFFHNDPQSLTPRNLRIYHNAIKPKGRDVEMEQRIERGKIPSPVILGGGEHQIKLTDEDLREAESMNISPETFMGIKRKREERKNKK